MGSAAPRALHEAFGVRHNAPSFGGDASLFRADDDRYRADAHLANGRENMGQQRAPGDRVQDLGHRRTHSGPLAGCKHDRKAGPSLH